MSIYEKKNEGWVNELMILELEKKDQEEAIKKEMYYCKNEKITAECNW